MSDFNSDWFYACRASKIFLNSFKRLLSCSTDMLRNCASIGWSGCSRLNCPNASSKGIKGIKEPADYAAPQVYMDSGVENINAHVTALIEANTTSMFRIPRSKARLRTKCILLPEPMFRRSYLLHNYLPSKRDAKPTWLARAPHTAPQNQIWLPSSPQKRRQYRRTLHDKSFTERNSLHFQQYEQNPNCLTVRD